MIRRFFVLTAIMGSAVFFSLLWSQPTAAQQQRVWPQTKNGIYVFTDQLDQFLTEKQWKFSAEHFIGSMRIIKDKVDTLRKYNSNFLVLQYFLGQGSGDHIYDVIGNDWVNVWNDISNRPGCFLTSENSKHPQKWILETDWNWYLADVDSKCWLGFVKSEILRRRGNDHFDGVFLDSASEPGYPFEPKEWWPTGQWPEGEPDYLPYWLPKLSNYFAEVYDYFQDPGRRHYVIPNVGHFIAVYSDMKWDNTDGIFIEGFSRWQENNYFTTYDWKVQMDRVLKYIQSGKVFIAHSYTTRDHIRDRMFIMGSFLLTKGNQSYISMSTEEDKKFPEWYPEYEIDLGPYYRVPKSIDELEIENSLYLRDYERGKVIVNPHDHEAAYTVPTREMWRVEIAGGGEVWSDGNFVPGVLYSSRASGVLTLEPHSAVVLLYHRPEPEVKITPSNQRVQPFFAYLQPRLQDKGAERLLARALKNDLEEIFGRGRTGITPKNWPKLVNAYIYGGYPARAIAQSVHYGGKTVHPWIPWQSFSKTLSYKEYVSRGIIEAHKLPVGDFSYGRARLTSSVEEQWLAQSLRQQLAEISGPSHYSFTPEQWRQLVNAYIYGGYPLPALVQHVKFGVGTVHPTIPWRQWRKNVVYKDGMLRR